MHDTVGIIYQFTQNDDENVILPRRESQNSYDIKSAEAPSLPSTSRVSDNYSDKTPKKRRKLEHLTRDVLPYYNKPSAKTNLMPYKEMLEILQDCHNNN